MLAFAPPALAQAAPPFDAQGYRNAAFRAPVDRDPAPATAMALADARRLAPGAALLVDVLPAEGAHRDPASGRWTLAAPTRRFPVPCGIPKLAAPRPIRCCGRPCWRG
jgi:hypothetical protein